MAGLGAHHHVHILLLLGWLLGLGLVGGLWDHGLVLLAIAAEVHTACRG